MKRIAIIGGGIAGLSAAFYLEKARRSGAAEPRPHKRLGLAGEVWNSPAGLVAEVEGDVAGVDAFCRELDATPPPRP